MDTYEKKYKEIVGKIRKAYLYAQTDSTKAVLEEIFPELKEGEDEKMRKELIRAFKSLNTIKVWNGIERTDILAWLEEQGENCLVNFDEAEKEKYDFVSGRFIECRKSFNEFKEDNSYWLEYIGDDTYVGRSDNVLNQKFHITPGQLFTLFTWQHRPKEDSNVNDEANAPTEYGKYVDECLNEASKHFFLDGEDKYSVADLFYAGVRCGKSWLEKQDPKKHEEELENAYKTADKVQYKRGYEDAIKEMEKQGEKHPDPYNGISFEYNGHIWGMCARDGGVEILMDGNITSRVFPDKNNIIEQKPTDSYCQENCKGFQETGKCFTDGECKAKREAEQKPVIKFKTAEESLGISSDEYNKIVDECLFGEQKLTEFERGLFDMLTDISKPCTADCVKSHSEKLLSIARKMIALEQKPAENAKPQSSTPMSYGKELEKRMCEACNRFYAPNTDSNRYSASDLFYAGVKAERDLNTLAWSEEDEKIINGLIDSLTRISLNTRTDSTSPNFSFYKEIDWLQSLRPQSQWKPSELQLGCLSDAIEHYNSLGYPAPKLKELLDDLKKIKEGKV